MRRGIVLSFGRMKSSLASRLIRPVILISLLSSLWGCSREPTLESAIEQIQAWRVEICEIRFGVDCDNEFARPTELCQPALDGDQNGTEAHESVPEPVSVSQIERALANVTEEIHMARKVGDRETELRLEGTRERLIEDLEALEAENRESQLDRRRDTLGLAEEVLAVDVHALLPPAFADSELPWGVKYSERLRARLVEDIDEEAKRLTEVCARDRFRSGGWDDCNVLGLNTDLVKLQDLLTQTQEALRGQIGD